MKKPKITITTSSDKDTYKEIEYDLHGFRSCDMFERFSISFRAEGFSSEKEALNYLLAKLDEAVVDIKKEVAIFLQQHPSKPEVKEVKPKNKFLRWFKK